MGCGCSCLCSKCVQKLSHSDSISTTNSSCWPFLQDQKPMHSHARAGRLPPIRASLPDESSMVHELVREENCSWQEDSISLVELSALAPAAPPFEVPFHWRTYGFLSALAPATLEKEVRISWRRKPFFASWSRLGDCYSD